MPEATLNALGERTELGSIMAADGGDCEEVLAQFAQGGWMLTSSLLNSRRKARSRL
jgi:hypothetical protein